MSGTSPRLRGGPGGSRQLPEQLLAQRAPSVELPVASNGLFEELTT
jgi:hypothetical protein